MEDLILNAYFFASFFMVLIIMLLLYIKASNNVILSSCKSVSKRNKFEINKCIEFIFLHICAFVSILFIIIIQYFKIVDSVIWQFLILILISFIIKFIYTFIIKKSILMNNLLSDEEMAVTVCFANLSMIFFSMIYYVSQEFTSLIVALFLGKYIALDIAFNFNIKEYKKTLKECKKILEEYIHNKEFMFFVILNIILLSFLYVIGIKNLIRVVSGSMLAALISIIIVLISEKLKTKVHN